MLFYLKYINHDVEKLQELLVYFFIKVEELSPITFDTNTLLPTWYNDYCNQPRNQGMRDLTHNLSIFLTFPQDIQTRIITNFRDANKIELLFSDKHCNTPTKFDFDTVFWKTEIKNGNNIDIMVSSFLKEFFADYLYDSQLGAKNSTFSKIINSDISKHYLDFKKESCYENLEFLICPICGIERIKDEQNIAKPDYDHLLPKSKFVFSSVNMKNLLPIGDDCNTLKKTKSLLHTDEHLRNRTLSFYPYSKEPHPFEQFTFQLSCIRESTKDDKGEWQVQIITKNPSDATLIEKIDTWDRVYQIKNRFAKYICDNHKNLIGKEFKITSIPTIPDLLTKLNEQLNRLQYNYYFLVTEIDLVPKRMFYEWALTNPSFLESFITVPNKHNDIAKDDLI